MVKDEREPMEISESLEKRDGRRGTKEKVREQRPGGKGGCGILAFPLFLGRLPGVNAENG
jgi:hypothetical protein